MKKFVCALLVMVLFAPVSAFSAQGIEAITIAGDGKSYSVTLQILAVMTVLTVLPSLLVMMTSFTRIIIVLSILRQAMGTPQTPSNQILLGLALFLTFFIMSPVFEKANTDALQPYLNDEMVADVAIKKAIAPFREFMLRQTRNNDLEMFARISGAEPIQSSDDVPLSLLLPAFVTSELKTAFQIGFMIFIPFLIIDMVVASVLMSMGMMMLSPLIISLPFKLMLFVLVDGWALIMETLAASFFS
ncbi:MAG: flagellar biosynthetic protein FliP [Piscirickettsiaceae bacterium]|nr:MAG: flagellar biosynthetic protein FliP [Piscirickettsiaceae bacterium]PCI67780.1 MAG: flagellar biosynthetic protein FliP [Piscirickettsiaceae bacterium]